MIAQPNHHFDHETLRELLEERLASDQAEKVELHLSGCDACRRELEQLAGQKSWWDETVDVLSESTVTPAGPIVVASDQRRALDASLDWIRPLLDEAGQDDGFLGRIDHYYVQDVVGQGGMGVVLRGVDPELNRPVAIKVLSPHLAGVGAARVRFMREAQAAAAVVHPSIVPIYSVVTSARLPYIVMPCINGGNLQERINRDGPLAIAEVIRIGLQIAEGLAAAHRNGVIHRDIKPANILIEEGNGRALISDFGLARALDDATLTNSGMIAGTPQYMSPEQARGESIDSRSDLFSLGSLLYAASTGRPPFRAETPLAVLRKISDSQPRPIQQVNEQMPSWLDRLVGRLMRTDISQRISTADEVVDLLREAHAHLRNPALHPLPESLAPRRMKAKWAFGAGICVALVASLLAIGSMKLFTPNGGNSPEPNHHVAVDATRDDRTSSDRQEMRRADPTELAWHDRSIDSELVSIGQTLEALDFALQPTGESSVTRIDSDTTVSNTVVPTASLEQGEQNDSNE